MSAIAYGLSRRNVATRTARVAAGTLRAQSEPGKKLVETIAAAVPVDVIALHALVLSATTKLNETTGATEITDRSPLKWSLPILMGLGALLFAVGRALPKPEPNARRWDALDWVRLVLPSLAFFAWAGLTGTSALTPWVETWSKGWIVLLTGAVGVVVVAVAAALSSDK